MSTKRIDGKVYQELNILFSITTDTEEYMVRLKECSRDDNDKDNVGIRSMYVFQASVRDVDSALKEIGKYDPGIHIIDINDIARNTGEKIVSAIQGRNSTALKEMFSINVSNEVSDLEEAAENVIEFVQGNIISYSDASEGLSFNTKSMDGVDGNVYQELIIQFSITTDTEEYTVALTDCTIDYRDGYNVGIRSMYVYKDAARDADSAVKEIGKYEPGIHIIDIDGMENDTAESADDTDESTEIE